MTTGPHGIDLRRLFFRGTLLAAVAATAGYLACSAGDDSQPDTVTGCTFETCFAACLERGLPGGVCDGDVCDCNDPGADADADADVADGEDGATDVDARDDGRDEATEVEAVDDGEATEDALVEDAPREDAGPRCTDLAAAWTFNGGPTGWTQEPVDAPVTGEWDPWELGEPTAGSTGCHGSATTNQCWATGLAGAYPACQRGGLVSPTLDLAACASTSYTVDVIFWHWHDFDQATGSADGGLVEVTDDGGGTWTALVPTGGWDGRIAMDASSCEGAIYVDGRDGFLGASGAWVQETIRVPIEHLTREFAFRFVFGSDAAGSADGWVIDDVAVRVR